VHDPAVCSHNDVATQAIKWDQQRSVLAVGLGLARCTSLVDLAPLMEVLGAVRGLLCAPQTHIAVPLTNLMYTFDATRICNSTELAGLLHSGYVWLTELAGQMWQWCGDDGIYVPHEPDIAAEIEHAFQAGFARITVMSLLPLDLELIVTLKVFEPSLAV